MSNSTNTAIIKRIKTSGYGIGFDLCVGLFYEHRFAVLIISISLQYHFTVIWKFQIAQSQTGQEWRLVKERTLWKSNTTFIKMNMNIFYNVLKHFIISRGKNYMEVKHNFNKYEYEYMLKWKLNCKFFSFLKTQLL